MSHQQEYFSGNDGLRMFENVWRPEADSKAVAVLVHGFTEHGGRYAHVAEALTRQGFPVYALDLRGHGRSEGDRIWVQSFDGYLDDVELYLDRVRRREPGKPVFLIGHSMGGAILALLAIERNLDAAGLVLSAPALRVADGVFPLLRRLAAIVARIFPRWRLVRMGSSKLSRDPDNIARFRADPFVFHGSIPVRTGAEIFDAMRRIEAGAAAIRLPFLLMQGTGDAVVDASAARELHDAATSPDKTLKLYDGLYHDLFGEPEREQVLADVRAWLAART